MTGGKHVSCYQESSNGQFNHVTVSTLTSLVSYSVILKLIGTQNKKAINANTIGHVGYGNTQKSCNIPNKTVILFNS